MPRIFGKKIEVQANFARRCGETPELGRELSFFSAHDWHV
ncbi:hypothetical protein BURMUCF2_1277 [Burkholderia multivorans CF2]|nr:hypothetical protein BURMUCF2_1277 [Burkholderia multivorans CF2]